MPNALDVAKQRKLIEDLKRNGETAEIAEERLNKMLQFIAWRVEAINKVARRARQRRSGHTIR
jgi:hypothetical protein